MKRADSGLILVAVLWISAILTAVCLTLAAATFLGQSQLTGRHGELAADNAMFSAVAAAKAIVLADDPFWDAPAEPWAAGDVETFTIELQDVAAEIFSPLPGGDRLGLEDESARMNANTASAAMLGKLPGLSAGVATAFVELRDRALAQGDVSEPLRPLSGVSRPFATQAQLAVALAASFTRERSYPIRADSPAAGPVPPAGPEEDDSDLAAQVEGVLRYLTVYTRQRNVDSRGRPRVNINTATESELTEVLATALSQEEIEAVLNARADRAFGSIGSLLTRPMYITDEWGREKPVRIDRAAFQQIADRLTVTDRKILTGLVNVNTAAAEVLRALPGVSQADAARIESSRNSLRSEDLRDRAEGIAWLLDVVGDETFAAVCSLVTTRSQQFRLHVRLRVNRTEDFPPSERNFSRYAPYILNRCVMTVLERDGDQCRTLLWLGWRTKAQEADNDRE